METFFIVVTSSVTKDYHVCSKYEQLPQMYHFKSKKDALECCNTLNERASEEYNELITLTTKEHFNVGIDKFITNY